MSRTHVSEVESSTVSRPLLMKACQMRLVPTTLDAIVLPATIGMIHSINMADTRLAWLGRTPLLTLVVATGLGTSTRL